MGISWLYKEKQPYIRAFTLVLFKSADNSIQPQVSQLVVNNHPP
jgi:hypothetical protein